MSEEYDYESDYGSEDGPYTSSNFAQGEPTIGGVHDGSSGWNVASTLDTLSGLFKTGLGAYNSITGQPTQFAGAKAAAHPALSAQTKKMLLYGAIALGGVFILMLVLRRK